MRPATLAEAIERIAAGEPQEMALPEFLDTFYLADTDALRLQSIEDTPRLTGDLRLDAFVGAMAEYLARQYELESIPNWVFVPERFLTCAWHVSQFQDDGMREYLTFSSPAEFRSRNIFTEARPLRRARSHLPFAHRRPTVSADAE
jgi:hypothetical protein